MGRSGLGSMSRCRASGVTSPITSTHPYPYHVPPALSDVPSVRVVTIHTTKA